MIASILRLSTLFIGVAVLLTGHGLNLAIVPLQAQLLGWTSIEIGFLSSTYFIGFLLGCYSVPPLVSRIGHIRTFATLTALMTAAILALSLSNYYLLWMVLRLLAGVAIVGLYLVIESWLNEQVTSDVRGGVLAIYTATVLLGLACGQLLLNAADLESNKLFVISAMLIVLAAIPVCMTRSPQPSQIPRAKFSPLLVLRTSRAAATGSFIGGMVAGSIYGLGPVYGLQRGLDVMSISFMMSLAILGGATAQLPLGRFSDRIDRRLVILTCMLTGSVVCGVAFIAPPALVPFIMFLFGASVMSIYALSLALASDNVKAGSFLQVGTGLLMINSIGSIVGPLITSQFMFRLGPQYFFASILLILISGAVLVLYTIRTKPAAEHSGADFAPASTASAQAALQMHPSAEPDAEDKEAETEIL